MALPPESFPPDRPPHVRAGRGLESPPVVLDTQSDREWLRSLFVKSLVAFPFVALVWYVVTLAVNTLFHVRLGPGLALIIGGFTAPFFFVPGQFTFVQELGCRRSCLFWTVPLAIGGLMVALALLGYVVGSPIW